MMQPGAKEAPWLSISATEEEISLLICNHKATILRTCVNIILFHAQNLGDP